MLERELILGEYTENVNSNTIELAMLAVIQVLLNLLCTPQYNHFIYL